jgi:hypothetical protein
MNLIELNRALRQLRLGGIAAVLETRLHQAQAEAMPPIDFLSCLVSDELTRLDWLESEAPPHSTATHMKSDVILLKTVHDRNGSRICACCVRGIGQQAKGAARPIDFKSGNCIASVVGSV